MSELARRMEVQGWGSYHAATVSRTESGERTPRLDEAVALARLLNTSLDALAGLETAQVAKTREIEKATESLQAVEKSMIRDFAAYLASTSESAEAMHGLPGAEDRGDDLARAIRVHDRAQRDATLGRIIESAVDAWLSESEEAPTPVPLRHLEKQIDELGLGNLGARLRYFSDQAEKYMWSVWQTAPEEIWERMCNAGEDWEDEAEGYITSMVAQVHGLP